MLRRTDPIAPIGLGMPHPALQRPAGRVTERTRWLWLVPLVVGFLTVFGWVASHDPGKGLALSNRGWLTIAAAAALMVLLSVHRTEGFGHLARVVAEYAVVAVLAVLGLACLWHQASQAAKTDQQAAPTTTTRPHRR